MTVSDISDVFVSYRRKNVEFAKQLVDALRETGREVWVDWEDIPPGSTEFTNDIARGLEGADAFICILSPDYMESSYCVEMELAYAAKLKKRLIPIVFEKIENHTIPPTISHINWIYFTPHAGQENTFEESMPRVLTALEEDYVHLREHKALLLEAIKWIKEEKKESYLLMGEELSKAVDWISTAVNKNPEPSSEHVEFINASREKSRRDEARTKRLTRLSMVLMGVAVLIFAVLGLLAFQNSQWAQEAEIKAQEQADIAKSRLLATRLADIARVDPFLAYGLGMDLLDLENTPLIVKEEVAYLMVTTGAVKQFIQDGLVTKVVITEDKSKIISGAYNGKIRIWDMHTKTLLHIFEVHTDIIEDIALVPNSPYFVSAGFDGKLIMWNIETGELVRTFAELPTHFNGVAASPDGKNFASISWDGKVRVWDIETGEELITYERDFTPNTTSDLRYFEPYEGWIGDIVYTPDGEALIFDLGDGTIEYWDFEETRIINEAVDNTNSSIAISPDGTMLATGSADLIVRLWDIETATILKTFSGHRQLVTDVAFMPDGKSIVSSGVDQEIRLWDVESGELNQLFFGTPNPVWSIAISADGSTIISAYGFFFTPINGMIVWTVGDSPIQHRLRHDGGVESVDISPDDQKVVTASQEGKAFVWDMTSGEKLLELAPESGTWMRAAAFSNDNTRIVTGGGDNLLYLWDAESGGLLNTFEGHEGFIWYVEFSPDDSLVASASDDTNIIIWNVETGEIVQRLEGHTSLALKAMFLADGKRLISSSADGSVRLWDLETSETIRTFSHEEAVPAIDISPDGKSLISGAGNREMILWDIETGEILRKYAGHDDAVLGLKYSPDGTKVFSSSADLTFMQWDVKTGEIIRRNTEHNNWVWAVDLTSDGRRAVSVSDDGQAIIWQLTPPIEEILEQIRDEYDMVEPSCEVREIYQTPRQCPLENPA